MNTNNTTTKIKRFTSAFIAIVIAFCMIVSASALQSGEVKTSIIYDGGPSYDSSSGIVVGAVYEVALGSANSALRVRSGPGTSYSQIGSLIDGEQIVAKGSSGKWVIFDYEDKTGYVYSSYLTFVELPAQEQPSQDEPSTDKASEPAEVSGLGEYSVNLNNTLGSANVYAGPAKYNAIIGLVKHGTKITVLEIQNNFARFNYNGKDGWVICDYLKLESVATQTTDSEPPVVTPCVLDTDNSKFTKGWKFGIDVSKWQSNIEWEKVKESGVDFVIIRAGYSGAKDKTFETNYEGAKAVGLDVGVYFYTYSTTVEGALKDANDCLSWIKGKTFEYPIYFDLEDTKQSGLGKAFNTKLALTFLNKVKESGYLTGIYAAASWLGGSAPKMNTNEILAAGHEAWVAKYYDNTYKDRFNYSQIYGMWQYSSKGKVPGIKGGVDVDVCYKNYPQLVRERCLNGYTSNGDADGENVVDIGNSTSTDLESVVDTDLSEKKDSEVDNTLPVTSDTIQEDPVIDEEIQKEIEEIIIKYGDLNSDGKINMLDVTMLQKFLADMVSFEKLQKLAADVDGDTFVKMADVVLIQKYVANIVDSLVPATVA